MIVACGIMILLMCFVVPKFKDVFAGMGARCPASTAFRHGCQPTMIKNNILMTMGLRGRAGHRVSIVHQDQVRTAALGQVQAHHAGHRAGHQQGGHFLVLRVLWAPWSAAGVPILQALTIVRETAGNVIIASAVTKVHESVKEGETITAPPRRFPDVFPPMVVSMVDVGEQDRLPSLNAPAHRR